MEYEQQPVYETPRPTAPKLWVGLTVLFALCCICSSIVATGEAVLLITGVTNPVPGSSSPSAAKSSFSAPKFCLEQPATGEACSPSVTKVPTSTKTIYATFDYKNMQKSGSSYSYKWTLNGDDVTGTAGSKSNQKWPRDGNSTILIKLTDVKPGDYELTITVGEDEQTSSIKVGP